MKLRVLLVAVLAAAVAASCVCCAQRTQVRTFTDKSMFTPFQEDGRTLVPWTFAAPYVKSTFSAGVTGPGDNALFRNWSFSIPPGKFIRRVDAEIVRLVSRSLAAGEYVSDYSVSLFGHKGSGSPVFAADVSDSNSNWTVLEATARYTNWGVEWTPEEVNSADFGLAIRAQRCTAESCAISLDEDAPVDSLTLRIANLSLSVTYGDTPGTTGTAAVEPTPAPVQPITTAARVQPTMTSITATATSAALLSTEVSTSSSSNALVLVVLVIVAIICMLNAAVVAYGAKNLRSASHIQFQALKEVSEEAKKTEAQEETKRKPRRKSRAATSKNVDAQSSDTRKPRHKSRVASSKNVDAQLSSDLDTADNPGHHYDHVMRETAESPIYNTRPQPNGDESDEVVIYNTVPKASDSGSGEIIYNTVPKH